MAMHEKVLAPPSSLPVYSSVPGTVLINVGMVLFVILMIIIACAWVVKRTRIIRNSSSGRQHLSVIASYTLGVRERVVLIEVSDQRILLGVTATNINLLASFAKGETDIAISQTSKGGGFQSALMKLLNNRQVGAEQ